MRDNCRGCSDYEKYFKDEPRRCIVYHYSLIPCPCAICIVKTTCIQQCGDLAHVEALASNNKEILTKREY